MEIKKKIPQDPIIFLSFINTQLRDFYSAPEELCADFEMDEQWLTDKMSGAGFFYKKEVNQFR